MAASDLVIRTAVAEDQDIFLDLMRHLKLDGPHTAPDVPEETFLNVIGHPGLQVLGGFVGKQLVASCTLIVIPNFMRAGTPYGLIENVVTHADHRQKGYGQAVVRKAVGWGFAAGCYKIMLLTGRTDPGIIKFYTSCGFDHSNTGFQVRANA